MVSSFQKEQCPFLLPSLKMENDGNHMTETILNLTLEIIYLLTGENYIAFKLSDGVTAPEGRSLGFGPSLQPLLPERNNEQKLMEVSSKLIELLTGEERDKDVYQEDPKEPDGSSNRNTSEPYPRPLYSQDFLQEDLQSQQDYQDEDMTDFKVKKSEKDTYERSDEECKEEIRSPAMSTDEPNTRNPPEGCASPLHSWDCNTKHHQGQKKDQGRDLVVIKVEDTDDKEETYVQGDERREEEEIHSEINTEGRYIKNDPEKDPIISLDSEAEEEEDITADSIGENPISMDFHPALHSMDLPPAPMTHGGCFPDRSHPVSDPPPLWGDVMAPCYTLNECLTQTTKLHARQKTQKSGPEPFSCSECGKSFTHKSNLDVHERIHNGHRPYPCSVCGKRFTQKSHLVTHKRIHTGEKPFSCSTCGKSFTDKSNLVTHQRTHTGLKPYSCPECGKSFARKSYLIDHQREQKCDKLVWYFKGADSS